MTNTSVFSRISHWFKPTGADTATLPLENERATLSDSDTDRAQTIPVTTFLKPWAKRDAALSQLQEGFNSLTDLMSSVKENLDRQSQRQDELLRILQHLPEALRAIPENARTQTETLKVVGEQLQRHNVHYHRLADVLEKVSDSASDQKKVLDALHDRVDAISQHDQSMADNMRSVSSAMQGVSQNTQTSARVLDQLNNNTRNRDVDLQWILHRQGTRVTVMLGVAILLSVAACATAGLLAWRLLH
jgi:methyl-accepting chemotaxis protein